ncbi:hypothetical protein GQ54DRAFT_305980 [Martensiomyces pterosporus]|nr:hypothetical protein GQ54DRAFT_305980 [Martensiomyces pterosporus]
MTSQMAPNVGVAASAYWSTVKLKKFNGRNVSQFIEEFQLKMNAQGSEEDKFAHYLGDYLHREDRVTLKCVKSVVGKKSSWAKLKEAFVASYPDDDDDENLEYQARKILAKKPSKHKEKKHVVAAITVLSTLKTWSDKGLVDF